MDLSETYKIGINASNPNVNLTNFIIKIESDEIETVLDSGMNTASLHFERTLVKGIKDIEKLINREIPKDVIDGYEPDPSIKAEPITRGRGQQQKRPRRKPSGSSSKKSPRPGKNARKRSTENDGGNSGNKTSSPWKKQSNGNGRTRDAQ